MVPVRVEPLRDELGKSSDGLERIRNIDDLKRVESLLSAEKRTLRDDR